MPVAPPSAVRPHPPSSDWSRDKVSNGRKTEARRAPPGHLVPRFSFDLPTFPPALSPPVAARHAVSPSHGRLMGQVHCQLSRLPRLGRYLSCCHWHLRSLLFAQLLSLLPRLVLVPLFLVFPTSLRARYRRSRFLPRVDWWTLRGRGGKHTKVTKLYVTSVSF